MEIKCVCVLCCVCVCVCLCVCVSCKKERKYREGERRKITRKGKREKEIKKERDVWKVR